MDGWRDRERKEGKYEGRKNMEIHIQRHNQRIKEKDE